MENLGNNEDQYYKDENAFIFSFNNNKIYKILKPELPIRFCQQQYPLLIWNNDNGNRFYFKKDFIYDGNLLCEPKVYDFEKNREQTNNKNQFNELEVFEIN